MQYEIKRGKRGKYWFVIRNAQGKAIAQAITPGYDSFAEADAAVQELAAATGNWFNASAIYN